MAHSLRAGALALLVVACAPAADTADTADTGDTGDTGLVERQAVAAEGASDAPIRRRAARAAPKLGAVAAPTPAVPAARPGGFAAFVTSLLDAVTADADDEPPDVPHGSSVTIDTPEALAELEGITRIVGDLTIRETELTDLRGLQDLRTVEGSLFIEQNPALVSLDGLEGLRAVGVELGVINNESLRDISALAGLQEVGLERGWCGHDAPTIAVFHNELGSVEPLRGLVQVNGSVTVRDNGELGIGVQDALVDDLPVVPCRIMGPERFHPGHRRHESGPDEFDQDMSLGQVGPCAWESFDYVFD